jgi:hypothetical protein
LPQDSAIPLLDLGGLPWSVEVMKGNEAFLNVSASSDLDLLEMLKEVVASRRPPILDSEHINEAVRELVELQDEETKVDTQLRLLRRRLNESEDTHCTSGRK